VLKRLLISCDRIIKKKWLMAGLQTKTRNSFNLGQPTAVRGSLDPIHETGRSILIWQRLFEKRSGEK
jgi:hypothetical protein